MPKWEYEHNSYEKEVGELPKREYEHNSDEKQVGVLSKTKSEHIPNEKAKRCGDGPKIVMRKSKW
ncbi:hypothetical protein [Cytobacillus kochii]|uniref:hypothetical protein n=1 Tax=Cytobacillus kochii TaxID=859143 RepID=UPI0025A21AD8|nr:hypothetical protein [Cytobacillus kochii]MDM5209382.1 hypothetical protein [Cytobacillus kochii]